MRTGNDLPIGEAGAPWLRAVSLIAPGGRTRPALLNTSTEKPADFWCIPGLLAYLTTHLTFEFCLKVCSFELNVLNNTGLIFCVGV